MSTFEALSREYLFSCRRSGLGGSGPAKTSSVVTDGQAFGDQWRVGGLRACSVLPRDMPTSYEPHCEQTWEAKIKSDRNCNALNAALFTACPVDAGYYHNACKLDMCECPGDACHCEVPTAYARECERASVFVHGWRNCQNFLKISINSPIFQNRINFFPWLVFVYHFILYVNGKDSPCTLARPVQKLFNWTRFGSGARI